MSDETTKRDISKAIKASEKTAATATRHKALQDRQAATSQASGSASASKRANLKEEAYRLGFTKIPSGISTGKIEQAVKERREEVRQQNEVKNNAKSELADMIKATLADLNNGGAQVAQVNRDFAMVQNKSYDPPAIPPQNYRPDRGSTNNFVPIPFYVYNNETGKVGTISVCSSTGFTPLLT